MLKRRHNEVRIFGEMERHIREAINLSWRLEEEEANGNSIQNVEDQMQRIVARAMQGFREDIQLMEKQE